MSSLGLSVVIASIDLISKTPSVKTTPISALLKPAKATSKASLPMPKKRKIGKFEIGLAFNAPETIYTIKHRGYNFSIAPGDVKDLIKILSQRDIVTKNPPGMSPLPEGEE